MARLIQEGVIAPFCSLLNCKDTQVIQVVLDGINNMLKMAGPQSDQLANMVEECGGLDKIGTVFNSHFKNKDPYTPNNTYIIKVIKIKILNLFF